MSAEGEEEMHDGVRINLKRYLKTLTLQFHEIFSSIVPLTKSKPNDVGKTYLSGPKLPSLDYFVV